ncbi:hypothetical protein BSR29_08450, partial [Boudabousia liubingyangii]
MRYDIKNNELQTLTFANSTDTTLDLSMTTGSLTFDPAGRLWALYANKTDVRPFSTRSVYYEFNSEDPQKVDRVVKGAIIPGIQNKVIQDITFTHDGDLVTVYGPTSSGGKEVVVYTWPKGSIEKSNETLSFSEATKLGTFDAPDGGFMKGTAWGPDQTLYFSATPGDGKATKNVWKVKLDGKNLTPQAEPYSPTPAIEKNIADMGSCWFGGTPPTKNDGFAVSKYPIDPFTGEVVINDSDEGGISSVDNTHAILIGPNGEATVRYALTVTNVSDSAEKVEIPAGIKDEVTAPDGFDIASIQIGNDSPAIGAIAVAVPHGEKLAGGKSKTFIVTVKLKLNKDRTLSSITAGKCESLENGKANGFFNSVTYKDDKDGPKNNDACVPFDLPKTAHVKLVKNVEGLPENLKAEAKDFFTLVGGSSLPASCFGSNPNPAECVSNPVTTVKGQGETEKVEVAIPKNGSVTYKLGEVQSNQPASGSELIGTSFKQKGEWSCFIAKSSTPFPGFNATEGTVTLSADSDVECTVTNVPVPNLEVVKTAANPEANDPHLGQAIEPKDGKLTAVYNIKVTNNSPFAANSGEVKDYFTVPAGLLWDGNATATLKKKVGATYQDVVPAEALTEANLAKEGGALLSGGEKLEAKQSVEFQISIPLAIDSSKAEGSDKTRYETNISNLTCKTITEVNGSTTHFEPSKGIVNRVELGNESETANNGNPTVDNDACIPVKATQTWRVEKAAKSGTGWADAGTSAATVEATQADKKSNNFNVKVEYKVTVTNNGPTAGIRPAITDNVTLPASAHQWTLTSIKYQLPGKTDWVTVPSSQGTSFEIPAGEAPVASGKSESILVTVEAHIQNPDKDDWKAAGVCNNKGEGTPGTGFFNKVTYAGDTDGAENNDACVPVKHTPGDVQILIRKTDDTGKFYLRGAEFKICEDNPNSNPNAECSSPLPTLKQQLGNCEAYPVDSLIYKACKAQFDGANDPTNKDSATFVSSPLKASLPGEQPKFYWLVETKAPECVPENKGENGKEYCASLLPQPLKFSVTSDGVITPFDGAGKLVEGRASSSQEVCNPTTDANCDPTTCLKPVDDTFYVFNGLIKVHDPRRGELPISGGTGPMPYALAAGLLLLLSLG